MRPAWVDDLHPFLHSVFLGVAAWQWVGIGILLVTALLGNWVGRWGTLRVLRFRDKARGRKHRPDAHRGLKAAIGLLCAANAPLVMLAFLDLPAAFDEVIRKGIYLAELVAVVLLAMAIWDAISMQIAVHAEDRRTSRILVPITRKFMRAFILVAAILIAIGFIFEINVTTVIASLGIGGLVIALAAKDSVENIFGSITILFDMPFGIGDWVRVGDVDGTVEEINLRSTRIRTFEDSVITLPNSNLIKASVENLGRRRFRRLRTELHLENSTPPDQIDDFCQELRRMFEAHPKLRPGFHRAGFTDMGENSLKVLIYVYIEAPDYNEELMVRHEIMLDVLRLADRMHIEFAPAGRTVYITNAHFANQSRPNSVDS